MIDYYNGLNTKLFDAVPADARRVLELGCANGRLGRRFKERHPGVAWVGIELVGDAAETAREFLDAVHTVDIDSEQLAQAGGNFDVVVIGDLLEHLRDPERCLERLHGMTHPDATIVCCLPNMAHASVLKRFLVGDVSYDDAGLLDRTHTRLFSPSSAFKNFLDAGWLPHLADSNIGLESDRAFFEQLLAAAAALGVPSETAQRNFNLYQMILVCRKVPPRVPMPAGAAFSVIVPVNRPWQYELNVGRSPGLREAGADIVVVQGATSAADAWRQGASRARHPWRLLAHQDVYFPSGSGHAIAAQLASLTEAGQTRGAIGFAGLHADVGLDIGLRKAGLLIDRMNAFDEPASSRAVSLDECAVALHADAAVVIDERLGWHLWATDLCLQGLGQIVPAPARALRVPLFHNSTTAQTVPQAFLESAGLMLTKYPRLASIPTLCGILERPAALQPQPQPQFA